jgi:hypothetical protein
MIYWELLVPRPPGGEEVMRLRLEYLQAVQKAFTVEFPDLPSAGHIVSPQEEVCISEEEARERVE